MKWEIAEKKSFKDIQSFIMERESGCVSLAARFKALMEPLDAKEERAAILIGRESDGLPIRSVVLVSQHGLVLPVFDETCSLDIPGDIIVLREMFSRFVILLHSVMGTERSVSFIRQVFKFQPTDTIPYHLLELRKNEFARPRSPIENDLHIRQATVRDAEKLLPLQREYELEEVFVDPSRFNERFCLANLKKTLKKEIVYMAVLDGKIVAKAGTNARGFSYDQIGGVYTVKEERRKGAGQILIAALLDNIFERKMKAALFVKKSNIGALTLYKKLGFSLKDNFLIAYYFNDIDERKR
jgi:uncharacterized protein